MNNQELNKLAISILNKENNEHNWLYVKLSTHERIDEIDKQNNYIVKPNDCRWWYGDTASKRYKKLCKNVIYGKRIEMRKLLELIVKLRIDFNLFIPDHPIENYTFEKNIFKPGKYTLCYKGLITNKIPQRKVELESCPICLEEFSNNNYLVTNCNHKFCIDCIFQHFQNDNQKNCDKCPLCRNVFVKKRKTKNYNRNRIIIDSDEEDHVTWSISRTGDNNNDDINLSFESDFNISNSFEPVLSSSNNDTIELQPINLDSSFYSVQNEIINTIEYVDDIPSLYGFPTVGTNRTIVTNNTENTEN
jgi:hypothetical protein